MSSSLWHNASLKQQLSQSEDDYEILPLEICKLVTRYYKLIVVLSLAQHISKTTVESKRGRLRICSRRLQTKKISRSRIYIVKSKCYFPLAEVGSHTAGAWDESQGPGGKRVGKSGTADVIVASATACMTCPPTLPVKKNTGSELHQLSMTWFILL